jgi:hypothetical protein
MQEGDMNNHQPEPLKADNTATGIPALNFMIGDWELDYRVTQHGMTTRTICGTGSIRPLFDRTYLTFDYQVRQKERPEKIGEAHAIIAWDKKAGQYRYFWFESSGTFLQANGSLSDDHTLALEWQGVNCRQIFRRVDADAMYLEMQCPDENLILRVDFARITDAGQIR